MFLIEPFVWMFRIAEFKKHIRFLFLYVAISVAVAFLAVNICNVFRLNGSAGLVLIIIALLSVLQLTLFISGYFWDLAENIIDRDTDIVAANIYDRKIRTVEKITLPEIKVLNMIWRGFASIVATILMTVPYILLSIISIVPTLFSPVGNTIIPAIAPIALVIMVIVLCPALLWNYAKQNSVVAVWNIPKAIYIIGNYPFRYMGKILLIGFIYFVLSFISSSVAAMLAISKPESISDISNINLILIYFGISQFMCLYFIYVYAYLIGTIAPPEEA